MVVLLVLVLRPQLMRLEQALSPPTPGTTSPWQPACSAWERTQGTAARRPRFSNGSTIILSWRRRSQWSSHQEVHGAGQRVLVKHGKAEKALAAVKGKVEEARKELERLEKERDAAATRVTEAAEALAAHQAEHAKQFKPKDSDAGSGTHTPGRMAGDGDSRMAVDEKFDQDMQRELDEQETQ